MKRTELKRKSPMRRTPMRKGKRKTKYASRERDFDFMLWVKTLPCLLAGMEGAGPCSGVTEADHAGLVRGIGMKSPDDTCIPLCTGHHTDRHSCSGFFRGVDKAEKREWRLDSIAMIQALDSQLHL